MELSVEKPEGIVKLYDENSGLWRFVKADKGSVKSVEVIEKALRGLGLSKNEVKVYVYLARTGEQRQVTFLKLCLFTELKPTEFCGIWKKGD